MIKSLRENLKYLRYYGIHSLSIRYFLTIFLILLIPFMSISYLVYKNDTTSLNKEMAAANHLLLSSTRQSMDGKVAELKRLANQALAGDDIELLSKLPYERIMSYDRVKMVQSLNNNLALVAATYDYMDSVHMISVRSQYVISPKSTIQLEMTEDFDWLLAMDREEVYNKWTLRYDEDRLLMLYSLNILYDNDYEAIILMNLDVERFFGELTGFEDDNHGLAVIDENNQIIYSNSFTMNQEGMDQLLLGMRPFEDGNKNTYYIEEDNRTYMVSKIDSDENDWSYVLLVPFDAYEDIQSGYTAFLVLLLTSCLIIAVVTSLLITIRSVSPINRIITLIDQKAKSQGIISNNEDRDKSINELKYIMEAIQETNIEHAEMTNELERRYEALRNARRVALQSQINPHFLFNSLESINWKVLSLTMGDNEASTMIQQLSKLLEFSLESSTNFIDIEKEIEHAKLYIEFQKKRYKNSFEVTFDVDDRVTGYSCISLMLQPVIENAIYHGIKPSGRINQMDIKVYLESDIIIFEVIDDGMGISPERLTELRSHLKQEIITDTHIGLANVNQRLRIIFGDHYGIELYSDPNRYTKVKISIPKVEIGNLSS